MDNIVITAQSNISNASYDLDKLSDQDRFRLIENEVFIFMINISFNSMYKGFKYFKDIITYIVFHKLKEINLSKELYPYICKKYNISEVMVEKSLRLAIEQASCSYNTKRDDKSYVHNCIKTLYMKPQNKNVIACVADIIYNKIYNQKSYDFNY